MSEKKKLIFVCRDPLQKDAIIVRSGVAESQPFEKSCVIIETNKHKIEFEVTPYYSKVIV